MNKGELIVMPTDTVYGLAAMLYDEIALQKIYEVKGREQSKQIPLLISSIDQIKDIATYDKKIKTLMDRFWPGALTIVMNTTDEFIKKTGESTIAIRMPKHPKALALIDEYGVLRVTSLNKSGEPPLESIEEIKKTFGHVVSEIYEQGDYLKSHVSSTVITFKNNKVIILRQGAIMLDELI
ncbi:threonylcarbamoyl-AMP synthase [Mycoplasmatota bacterium]|nr:threonylcarbamoyl-AMP synthase [Mycoplasmatota bacterium]